MTGTLGHCKSMEGTLGLMDTKAVAVCRGNTGTLGLGRWVSVNVEFAFVLDFCVKQNNLFSSGMPTIKNPSSFYYSGLTHPPVK